MIRKKPKTQYFNPNRNRILYRIRFVYLQFIKKIKLEQDSFDYEIV